MVGPDKGDGSFERTRVEVARAGLTNRVRFAGKVPKKDVPKVISQADIFLNTTNIDNTPVSVIEAMACGLCIVTTRVGGTPFLIRHEKDGLLVAPGDTKAMDSSVARFITEETLARNCSKPARAQPYRLDSPTVLPDSTPLPP